MQTLALIDWDQYLRGLSSLLDIGGLAQSKLTSSVELLLRSQWESQYANCPATMVDQHSSNSLYDSLARMPLCKCCIGGKQLFSLASTALQLCAGIFYPAPVPTVVETSVRGLPIGPSLMATLDSRKEGFQSWATAPVLFAQFLNSNQELLWAGKAALTICKLTSGPCPFIYGIPFEMESGAGTSTRREEPCLVAVKRTRFSIPASPP